ncbi:hypothetical protein B0H19DRAFT_1277873 [Mycena capillaripes]|nr:hypothetical protein B0H19DRAFT_1277873 [Mycena capillaripes]
MSSEGSFLNLYATPTTWRLWFSTSRTPFSKSRVSNSSATLEYSRLRYLCPNPSKGRRNQRQIPFKLDGIKRADFQALLKVLYPMSAIPKLPELKREEWISVLHLASLWDFIEVRDLAVQQLSLYAEGTLNATERIVLGRKHDVSSWLRSGYTELAKRKTPISSEEAAKIGWEVTLQICQLREAAVAPEGRAKNPYESVSLGTTFQAEFKRADEAHRPLWSLPRISAAKSPIPSAGAAPATTGAQLDPFLFLPTFLKAVGPSKRTLDLRSGFAFKASTSALGTPTATTSPSPSTASSSTTSASTTAAASAASSGASGASTVSTAAPTGIPATTGPFGFSMPPKAAVSTATPTGIPATTSKRPSGVS